MPRQFGVPEEVIQSVLTGESSPSVYSPYMSAIHNRHVIGINIAYMIGEWIDIILFGDNRFFLAHRAGLAAFPGIVIGCHPKAARYDWVKHMARDRNHPRGISPDANKVSWNYNTGAAAISIAANSGVSRIVLLGFDMKRDEKDKGHWHDLYKTLPPTRRARKDRGRDRRGAPYLRHLRGFPDIAKDAKRRGITIINASPDSAIEQFKKITVKQLLDGQV